MSVFISHSHDDAEDVRHLVEYFRTVTGLGHRDFFCTSLENHRVDLGQGWSNTIRQRLDQSKAIVALITPWSVDSQEMWMEIGYAYYDPGTVLIPLLLGVDLDDIASSVKHLQAGFLSDPSNVEDAGRAVIHATGARSDANWHSAIDKLQSAFIEGYDTASLDTLDADVVYRFENEE